MGIRIQSLEVAVPEDNPFKYDLLGREEPAKTLTNLVESLEGQCVVGIDAPWGGARQDDLPQDVGSAHAQRGVPGGGDQCLGDRLRSGSVHRPGDRAEESIVLPTPRVLAGSGTTFAKGWYDSHRSVALGYREDGRL